MNEVLCRDITRRVPFELENLPWILKVYRYPFDRWSTVGRQGLFGAHNFLLYYLYQNYFPTTLQGTFLYSIGGTKKRIRFNSKNAQFHSLYFKAYARGYEPQVSALIDQVVPDDGVFYDIGSNWGWFSLLLASRPGFKGRIYAFEPFPKTFDDLSDLVAQAGIEDTVKCRKVAVSDRASVASISIPDHIHSGCATIGEEGKGVSVQTTALDALDAEPPDFMKVDVEDAELQVFMGGQQLLQKHKPMIVFENRRDRENPAKTLQPLLFLQKLGYTFYHVAWLRQVDGSPCLIGDEFDPSPQPQETLALVPFESAQRFLLHDAMNILACHRDKTDALKARFQTRAV